MTTGAESTVGPSDAGAAPLARRVGSRARLEIVLLLRNGEQLLLTLILPALLLLILSTTSFLELPGEGDQVGRALPGVLALAILSTSFTALAISTAFDRRYGVLRQVGVGPLGRSGLITAKILATLVIVVVQLIVLGVEALLLGWSPSGAAALVLVLATLGVWAFSGLALLMAGTLRAEATLALANLVYVLLLLGGGLFFDPQTLPAPWSTLVQLLPSAALADGLRAVLVAGTTPSATSVLVLTAWGLVGTGLAVRWLRWDS
jgi:ABC-2 type transport system permease protein